jgi:MFS transporter, NNP family, nitrate/nitrite transporter
MKISDIKSSGHWPTLVASFLYFDVSFMIWTLLGPLGVQIGESLRFSAEQKGMIGRGADSGRRNSAPGAGRDG